LPTHHACTDGSHLCDTTTTQCIMDLEFGTFLCLCLEGFVHSLTDMTSCAATPAPTAMPSIPPTMVHTFAPSVDPTSIPTVTLTATPTASPTIAAPTAQPSTTPTKVPTSVPTYPTTSPTSYPTPAPTPAKCADGLSGLASMNDPCVFPFTYNETTYHDCTHRDSFDGITAWCATVIDGDGVSVTWGGCKDCDQSSETILESVEAGDLLNEEEGVNLVTASPSPIPDALLTKGAVVCADGSHGCDTFSTQCTVEVDVSVSGGLTAVCECNDGYAPDPDSLKSCNALPSPQPTPTPTHVPTYVECNAEVNGCDTDTQICSPHPSAHCICRDGFHASTNSNDSSNKLLCVMTPNPTPSPTLEATLPPSIAPTAPTAMPSPIPTTVPTYDGDMCNGTTHDCDTVTTVCITKPSVSGDSNAPLPYTCECVYGYEKDPSNIGSCIQATLTPTADPTASGLVGTLAPTLAPTHPPSQAPTWPACADGNHGCDEGSTRCVSLFVEGESISPESSVVIACECREGFVPNITHFNRCEASGAPTSNPTHTPTGVSCTMNIKACDLVSTRCVEGASSDECVCECLEGFVPCSPLSDVRCCGTDEPTSAPSESAQVDQSQPPSFTPSMVPSVATTSPTHLPTWNGCDDGAHGCETDTTRCVAVQVGATVLITCDCIEGFHSAPTEMFRCFESTPEPTGMPSHYNPALATPVPAAPPPSPLKSNCDPASTTNQYKPYCKGPDRNLTVWVLPGAH
jgi:hypothetical protein